jgi:hypothetical protein
VAAVLAAVLWVPAVTSARQLSASTEVQGAVYPTEPSGRQAIDAELRGWSSVEFDHAILKHVTFSGDLIVYGSNQRQALVDGEAKVAWRGGRFGLAAGLLRERWGRFTDSPLDPLGPSNTPFSLVEPELRLAQPTLRGTLFFDGLSVDVYGLAGHRSQPLPEHDGRFGFGVPTGDDVRRGGFADQAIGFRVSGTELDVDWAAHLFNGLSRRPTFVPSVTPDGRLAGVNAVYTQILQAGGEVETTRADWRFLAEGFGRGGAVDVTGQEHTYLYAAAAAEYQRLGAFGGAYNIIPRLEIMTDTRGDRADIPFGSGARAAMRIAQTRRLPAQVDMAYSYDWAFRGHSVLASVEKALAESPTFNLGFRFTAFSAGAKPSVLDIWHDDLELFSYVRVGLSR